MSGEYPVLSPKERDRRWARTRELMQSSAVECLLVAGLKGREELEGYLTNEYAEGIVVFPLGGEPVYLSWTGTRVLRRLEDESRGDQPWVGDMRVGPYGPTVVSVLREKGLERARIGVVGLESKAPGEMEGCIPYKTWAHVLKELPGAVFVELSEPFAEMMLVKSDEELALMRHSAAIGEKACEVMLERVKPGATEREVYTAILKVVVERGGFPPAPFLIIHSGQQNLSWGPPAWHYRGGPTRAFRPGDTVQAEIFPRYGGFESQQQMAIHLGPPSAFVSQCATVARRSYEAGLSALRPGATFGGVCDAMEAPLQHAGCWHLTPLIHSLSPASWTSGTGVGVEEAPGMEWAKGKIRSRGASGGDLVIRPGMVFELEPNACRAKHRINIGGTVIVNEKGAEELNRLPTKLHVI